VSNLLRLADPAPQHRTLIEGVDHTGDSLRTRG
jgi:hypothetical protein